MIAIEFLPIQGWVTSHLNLATLEMLKIRTSGLFLEKIGIVLGVVKILIPFHYPSMMTGLPEGGQEKWLEIINSRANFPFLVPSSYYKPFGRPSFKEN